MVATNLAAVTQDLDDAKKELAAGTYVRGCVYVWVMPVWVAERQWLCDIYLTIAI